MDTMQKDPQTPTEEEGTARSARRSRGLLGVALACFALPFLTVTCYGDDVTVSGVQAVTTIDLTPQAEPDPGDRQFADEGEPPNAFAFIALVGTAAALALSFGSSAMRRGVVWAAAVAVLALEGLYLYAFYRAQGHVVPDVGLTAATTLLLSAAWVGAGQVPRWIGWSIGVVAAATIPYSLLETETQMDLGWVFVAFVAAGLVSVCLAVGAIRATIRPPAHQGARPFALRAAIAGVVGLVFLAAAGVASPLILGEMISDEMGDPGTGSSWMFAMASLGGFVAGSVLAWMAGHRIVHGPRRRSVRLSRSGTDRAMAGERT